MFCGRGYRCGTLTHLTVSISFQFRRHQAPAAAEAAVAELAEAEAEERACQLGGARQRGRRAQELAGEARAGDASRLGGGRRTAQPLVLAQEVEPLRHLREVTLAGQDDLGG